MLLKGLWTKKMKSKPTALPTVPPKQKMQPSAWVAFCRSVGLNILLLRNLLGFGRSTTRRENEKVLVSTSRRISFVRTAVHLPPIIITLFLLLWNGIGFLNGGQITTSATFFLQLLAKLHVRVFFPLQLLF